MIFFVGVDTIAGIYASIKIGGITAFKSTKFFNIVVKSFFYLSTIIMAFLIDKFIFGGTLFTVQFLLSKVMSMLWIYNEIKSLDETSIRLGNRSFWVILKEFVSKLKDLKKDLNEIVEDKKDKTE